MFEREARCRAAVHVAVLLRPAQPAGCASVRRAKIAIQRVEPGVQLQRQCRAARRSSRKSAAAFAAASPGACRENLDRAAREFRISDPRRRDSRPVAARAARAIDRANSRIGHTRARRRAFLELRHRRHRDVQDVEKMPARRAVGTRSCRIRRRQRVQGIQADEAGAARRHPANQQLADRENRRCPNCRGSAAYTAAPRRPRAAGRRRSPPARSISAAKRSVDSDRRAPPAILASNSW